MLLGATIDGPPPLGRVHVPLDEGLTVLFGLNGAGKTRLLEAVRRALLGIDPGAGTDAVLHLRVADPEMPINGPFLGAVVRAARSLLDTDEDIETPEWFKPEEQGGTAAWVDLVDQTGTVEALTLPSGAREDVGYGGLLSCYAVGTAAEPAWKVYVSCTERTVTVTARSPLRVGDVDLPGEKRTYLIHGEDRARVRRVLLKHESYLREESAELARELIDEVVAANHYIGMEGPRLRALLDGSDIHLDAHWETDHPWPSWLPLPLWELGTVRTPPVRVWSGGGSVNDLAQASVTALLEEVRQHDRHVMSMADHAELALDESFAAAVSETETRAVELLRAVLPDGPRLRLDMRHPEEWIIGKGPRWLAQDVATSQWVPLEEHSTAQRKWVTLAIDLALNERRNVGAQLPFVALADEPEGGLHRRLDKRLAQGLASLGQQLGAAMVVATHSPALLNEQRAALHEVRRAETDGRTVLAPLVIDMPARLSLSRSAAALGLDVADLLQLLRVAVIVEGEHDDVVINTLLAEDLQDGGCWVLPLRGAKNAPSLSDAQLLFDATSAQLLIVLDNLDHDSVRRIWTEAQEAVRDGDVGTAKNLVKRLADGRGGEGAWLSELALRALERGTLDRVHPFGLSQPDILMYLPVGDFVPGDGDWDHLHQQYSSDTAAARRPNDPPKPTFKQWLRRKHKAKISTAAISTSASHLADVPADLVALGLRVRELGSHLRGNEY